jgi:hypothetical protein
VVRFAAASWVLAGAFFAVACRSDALPKAPPPTPPAGSTGRVHILVEADDTGKPSACKLLLSGGALTPNYGTSTMVGQWLAPRALGVGNAIYGDPCDVTLELPIGPFHIQASRGIEYELAQQDVMVSAAGPVELRLRLVRALDTHGYACADFHVHSAPSFDSDVPLDQRLISAVGEGLDAIAPTDHEIVGDWQTEQAMLGMADTLTLVIGNEVTPDQWAIPQAIGHFGMFPVPPDFDPSLHQMAWQSPAALLERLDNMYPDTLIQVNHPRWDSVIGYLSVAGFNPLDPKLDERLGLEHLDAIELWNSHEIDATGGTPLETTFQDYFALLELGVPLVATGNTDTHELSRHPLGYPRNCIRVDDDAHPGLTADAVVEGVALGRVMVTSGPWLEVSLDGHGPGDRVTRPAEPVLKIQVDAAGWVPVDRVHVVVNGQRVATRELSSVPSQLEVPLELPNAVSYIMVMVEGDGPLPDVAGYLNHPERSYAFSNPIWVQAP